MLSKTEAIVLRSLKYGEQRVIVDMFTLQHGRVSFMVSLPRSGRGKLKKQFFQPMTLLAVEADIRQQVQLQKLRDAALLAPLPSLHGDPSKLAIVLFLSEFLYYALKSEQQNELLFSYVRSSMQWLEECRGPVANFHIVFLMRLSRFLGFYPNLEQGAADVYFDLRGGTFMEAPPLHRDFLMPQEAGRLRLLMRMDYATMHLFRLSRAERSRILELLLFYYRLHLPDFPELRSTAVLHDLFD